MRATYVRRVPNAGDSGNLVSAFNAARPRLEAITEMAVNYGHPDLAQRLIDVLDRADGDADVEDDTEDGCGSEDAPDLIGEVRP